MDTSELDGIRRIVFKDNCVTLSAAPQAPVVPHVKFVKILLKFAFIFPFVLIAVIVVVLYVHQCNVFAVIILEDSRILRLVLTKADSDFDACADEAFDETFVAFLLQVTGGFIFKFFKPCL